MMTMGVSWCATETVRGALECTLIAPVFRQQQLRGLLLGNKGMVPDYESKNSKDGSRLRLLSNNQIIIVIFGRCVTNHDRK